MGVPSFFRWVRNRYPKVVCDCVEAQAGDVEGVEIPVDLTQPNPNGMEFDNLYLDMNGIIHPCFHPSDNVAPTCEREVFLNVFAYMDRLFSIVRPRKLLFLAIDGVAPRAKMNQQRSRRFRAAQEAAELRETEARLRAELAAAGMAIAPAKDSKPPPADGPDGPDEAGDYSVHDSNVITPGTPFMHRLSVALQYYVHVRQNGDPAWAGVKVVLSDANAPGEGEHKIMAYIRKARATPGHDPNTRHCLYGLDADLIMLALATHEPKFCILREVVLSPQEEKSAKLAAEQRALEEAMSRPVGQAAPARSEAVKVARAAAFEFLKVGVLREYLSMDLDVPDCPFVLDRERLFDDFVLMCCFVGNDFLPHMPTLEIREEAIELLMATYRRLLPQQGYLCRGSDVHLDRVERFMAEVGACEKDIFARRTRMMHSQVKRRRFADGGRGGRGGQGGGKWRGGTPAEEVARNAQALRPELSKTAALQRALHGGGAGGEPIAEGKDGEQGNRGAAQALRARMKRGDGEGPEGDGAEEESPDAPAKKKPRVDGAAPDPKAFWGAVAAGDASAEKSAAGASAGENAAGASAGENAAGASAEKSAAGASAEKSAAGAPAASSSQTPAPSTPQEAPEMVLKRRMEEHGEKDRDKFDEMVAYEEGLGLDRDGFRERYYALKLKVGPEPEAQREPVQRMVEEYIRGLVWVMNYYYCGVPAWDWYYPYHYAPFASDMRGIKDLDIRFELGKPFKPFDQLMGVFPAASAHALPKPYRRFFADAASPILDFYPEKFATDMNGKRFAYQAVVLLPFIDQNRLLDATRSVEADLTAEEAYRNGLRSHLLFVPGAHPAAGDLLEAALAAPPAASGDDSFPTPVPPPAQMPGRVGAAGGDPCPPRVRCPYAGLGDDVTDNTSVCVAYDFSPPEPHASVLLPGAEEDAPELTVRDRPDVERPLWHAPRQPYGGGPGRFGNGGPNGAQNGIGAPDGGPHPGRGYGGPQAWGGDRRGDQRDFQAWGRDQRGPQGRSQWGPQETWASQPGSWGPRPGWGQQPLQARDPPPAPEHTPYGNGGRFHGGGLPRMGVAGMSAMPPGGADEAARGMSDRAGLSGSHVGYGVPGYDPRMGPPRSGYAPGAHQMAPPPVVRPDLYQHEPGRPFPPDFPGWDRRLAADPQRGAFRDGFFSSQPLMEPQMTRLHREDAGARRGREGNGNRFGALQPRRP